MTNRFRTHGCGDLRAEHIGEKVVVSGWLNSRRDHGGLIFVDLRDRSGLVQVVADPDVPEAFKAADSLRTEFVARVEGKVRHRPKGTDNPHMPTGQVEIAAEKVEVLNAAKTPPFEISEHGHASEELRLKYRYLDLRRPKMQANLLLRHRMVHTIREYLDQRGFADIETPILTKSTPEGARDFLVPSRLSKGRFYALPQSPQLFKQILMVAGMERYYQIARCFRDEDLRADRQLEFTQLDLEMSFVDEADVQGTIEGLMAEILKKTVGVTVKPPFPRMSYAEAMGRFGSDKPDLRFGLEIKDVGSLFKSSGFKVFASAPVVRALHAPVLPNRSELDNLTKFATELGAKGLVWIKWEGGKPASPVAKFLSETELGALKQSVGAQDGHTTLLVADRPTVAAGVLGALRLELARRYPELGPNGSSGFHLSWVVDFPLFEWSEEETRWVSVHHPFTSPSLESLEKLPEVLAQGEAGLRDRDNALIAGLRARGYDLVMNGSEIGGGSIRIHNSGVQATVFKLLGISEEQARARFGFLLDALEFGAPPHGGLALGLDRISAMLCGAHSIREVIAFPKTAKGTDPMTDAPSDIDPKQLKDLGLRILE